MGAFSLCLKLCSLLVVLLAVIFGNFLTRSDWWTVHEYHGAETCRLLKGVRGAEDITSIGEGIALMPTGDIVQTFFMRNFGPYKVPRGGIAAIIKAHTCEPELRQLALTGFPEELLFLPHGIYYRKEEQELYVINHAYAKGGERIDVFSVTLPSSKSAFPSVQYNRSLTLPAFSGLLGGLNNLAFVSSSEFYVSIWLPYPDLPGGHYTTKTVRGTIRMVQQSSVAVLGLKKSYILHCTGATGGDTGTCVRYGEGLAESFNGVALTRDKSKLLVSDSPQRKVFVFDIDTATGALNLSRTISTGSFALDNIEPDEFATEDAYTIAIMDQKQVIHVLTLAYALTDISELAYTVDSGMGRIVLGRSGPGGTTSESEGGSGAGAAEIAGGRPTDQFTPMLFMDSREEGYFSAASAATIVSSEGAKLLGSFYDDGVMFCPPPGKCDR